MDEQPYLLPSLNPVTIYHVVRQVMHDWRVGNSLAGDASFHNLDSSVFI